MSKCDRSGLGRLNSNMDRVEDAAFDQMCTLCCRCRDFETSSLDCGSRRTGRIRGHQGQNGGKHERHASKQLNSSASTHDENKRR